MKLLAGIDKAARSGLGASSHRSSRTRAILCTMSYTAGHEARIARIIFIHTVRTDNMLRFAFAGTLWCNRQHVQHARVRCEDRSCSAPRVASRRCPTAACSPAEQPAGARRDPPGARRTNV